MFETTQFEVTHVPDLHVLSLRAVADHGALPDMADRIRRIAGSRAAGAIFCLHHRADDSHAGTDRCLEMCVPLSDPVDVSGCRTIDLPGGAMLVVRRRFAAHAADARWGASEWWKDVLGYLIASRFGFETLPMRETLLPQDASACEASAPCVRELQFPLLFPRWRRRLSDALTQHVDASARQEILGRLLELPLDDPPESVCREVASVVARLDRLVPDADTRTSILRSCAHTFPRLRIERLRSLFQSAGLSAVLQSMRTDRSDNGLCYYETFRLVQNVLWVTKNPTEREIPTGDHHPDSRVCRCHCGLIRPSFEGETSVSPTFCDCGTGWYAQLWEGILERPVRVEQRGSLLRGDPVCRFAIHLPEDAIEEAREEPPPVARR